MDEPERLALEREVQSHLARVEELLARLRESRTRTPKSRRPRKWRARCKAIRIELRGRMAAISMGESRLGIDPF